jgi:hypothetical protein
MKKTLTVSAALLISGSAWAGVLDGNPDLYGSILLDKLDSRESAIASQPGAGDSMDARSGAAGEKKRGYWSGHPDLGQSVLNDVEGGH